MAIYRSKERDRRDWPIATMARVTKALGDPNRLRILNALRHGELCVCQIIELLPLAQSTVSKHLAILRSAGLIESRKSGRWIYCRRADPVSPRALRDLMNWLNRCADIVPEFRSDSVLMRKIIRLDKEKLCRQQLKKK